MGCCCKKYKNEIKNLSSLIHVSLSDFKQLKVLGKGKYGKVFLVEHIETKKLFAMKRLKKSDITNLKKIEHIKTERNLLENLNHPFIVKLYYAFQDKENLYFVTDFMQGGEFFSFLSKSVQLKEKQARFYLSEILLALEYIHNNKCIYRDLKPENILIDKDGHLKLSDFGLSKILNENNFAYTICGTPEYEAPEIYKNIGYDKMCDWWSFGIIMFEMIEGYIPFKGKINDNNLNIMFSDNRREVTKDLIMKLLVLDPKKRLGFNGIHEIKNHKFFDGVNFDNILNKKEKPPFIPAFKDKFDLRYFNSKYTEMDIESFCDNSIMETKDNDPNNSFFEGFSYYDN